MRRLIALVPVALTALLVAADAETAEPVALSALIVTVDCLRPDHMGVYGYERDTTPYLSRFAAESVVFERAFATSAWTSPGVSSLFTGFYPPVHAQNGQYSFYDPLASSPIRLFAANGIVSYARTKEGPTYEDFGFGHDLLPLGTLEELIEYRAHPARKNQRFFAWVHLTEPHLPYNPSEYNARRWGGRDRQNPAIEAVNTKHVIFREAGDVTFAPEDVPVVRALYDGKVAEADDRLGRALERMRETGLLDNTVVVLTADHGEELLEHGWVGHASTSHAGHLYDELMRIPLIVRVPGDRYRGRRAGMVQQVDVMPTLIELLGLDAGALAVPMQGRSLVPLLAADGPGRDVVFAETTLKGWGTPRAETSIRVTAARSADRKLVRGPDGRLTGYDLRADPGETRDAYAESPDAFAPLREALARWDAENRDRAAALAIDAVEKEIAAIEQAIARRDPAAAALAFRNIQRTHDTYAQERDPFFRHPPHAKRWAALLARAADRMQAAARLGGKVR